MKREAESNTETPEKNHKKETGHKESNKETDSDELEGEVKTSTGASNKDRNNTRIAKSALDK